MGWESDMAIVSKALERHPTLCHYVMNLLSANPRKPSAHAERQRRYRDRRKSVTRDASVTGVRDASVTPNEAHARQTQSPDPDPESFPSGKSAVGQKASPHHVFIAWFSEKYKEATNSKYSWNIKETAMVKALLKSHGLEECQMRAARMFEEVGTFFVKVPTMGTLSSHFNRFVTVTRDASVTGTVTPKPTSAQAAAIELFAEFKTAVPKP